MPASGYDLEETIARSPVDIISGPFFMVKLPSSAVIPSAAVATFRDQTELTVVLPEPDLESLPCICASEGPFGLLRVRVSVPFVVEGFLAAITAALGGRNINVLVWSTFSYDYAFVRSDELREAAGVLIRRGFPAGAND